MFHLDMAGGSWSCSPATLSPLVARQRLASDNVAPTIRGLFDSLPWPLLSMTEEQKCNHTVIMSFCPRTQLLVKGKVPFVESPTAYLWHGRSHFHHTVTHWKEKVSEHDRRSLAVSHFTHWQIICWCIGGQRVVCGTLRSYFMMTLCWRSPQIFRSYSVLPALHHVDVCWVINIEDQINFIYPSPSKFTSLT